MKSPELHQKTSPERTNVSVDNPHEIIIRNRFNLLPIQVVKLKNQLQKDEAIDAEIENEESNISICGYYTGSNSFSLEYARDFLVNIELYISEMEVLVKKNLSEYTVTINGEFDDNPYGRLERILKYAKTCHTQLQNAIRTAAPTTQTPPRSPE